MSSFCPIVFPLAQDGRHPTGSPHKATAAARFRTWPSHWLGQPVRQIKALTFLLGLLLSGGGVFAGGGWTLEKGEVRVELGYTYLKSDQLFGSNNGFIQLRRPVLDQTLQAFGEYGLWDDLTLIGRLPFKLVSTDGMPQATSDFADTLDAGSLNTFGNAALGARWRVLETPSGRVLSIEAMVEANTSDYNLFTGLQSGFDAWSVQPVLAFGLPFGRSYVGGHAGMAIRSNGYSEEGLFVVEAGYRLTDFGLWMAGVADVRWNFKNGERPIGNLAHTGLYVNNQASVSYGIKAWSPIAGGFGLTAGAYGAVYAEALAGAPTFNVGIYYQRKRPSTAQP
jgi:hypothetical protein